MKCHHIQHRSPLKAKNIYVFIWYNLHRLLQWACSKDIFTHKDLVFRILSSLVGCWL